LVVISPINVKFKIHTPLPFLSRGASDNSEPTPAIVTTWRLSKNQTEFAGLFSDKQFAVENDHSET
jgi:hypothetical protein